MRKANKSTDWILATISFIVIITFQIVAAFKGLLWVNAVGFSAYIIIPLICTKRSTWNELGLSKPQKWIPVFIGIIACGVILLFSYLASSAFAGITTGNFYTVVSMNHIQSFNIQANNHWKSFLLSSLTLCLFSPLTEELYFRGFLLKSFEKRFGFRCANIVQALFFGLIHIAYCWIVVVDVSIIWNVVPSITLIGLVYGWVRNKTKSILPAMATHLVANLFVVIIIYALQIPQIL